MVKSHLSRILRNELFWWHNFLRSENLLKAMKSFIALGQINHRESHQMAGYEAPNFTSFHEHTKYTATHTDQFPLKEIQKLAE